MDATYEKRLRRVAAQLNAGRVNSALALLRKLQHERPEDPRLECLYGMVELRRGDLGRALLRFERCAERAPGFAESHAQLGAAYDALERFEEAAQAWSRYTALLPSDPRGHLGAGGAMLALGDDKGAEQAFQTALDLGGDSAADLTFIGLAYQRWGFYEQAAARYERALRLVPRHHFARHHLAMCRHALGDFGRAKELYSKVLSAQPKNHEALCNLGTLYKETGELELALQHYVRAMRIVRRVPAADSTLAGDAFGRTTSLHKLRLELEQLENLRAEGALPDQYAGYLAGYRDVIAELERTQGGDHRRRLTARQYARVGRLMHKLVHVRDCDAPSDGVLNPTLDFSGLAEQYHDRAPGLVVIDEFLAPDALAALRAYCVESTIWFDFAKAGGYCGAYMEDGFGNPLLAQLAREVREKLPSILGPHGVQNMWAYIYDHRMSGISLHADAAAVNLNFWLTPDSACEDAASGGMVVYLREAPLEWDFDLYNNRPDDLRAFLRGAEKVVIPYRCNRLVMFHSNLIHETDRFSFRAGLHNRRINVTMLFGERAGTGRRAG